MPITDLNTIRACVLGHAVGDALGVPVEFESREALDADPVVGMREFGSFGMPAGSWSDDTSMSLCGLEALSHEVFSWDDVMINFGKWFYKDEFTPTDEMFDVGSGCAKAIENYFAYEKELDDCAPRGEADNGNGSLMRIIPFSLYAPNDLGLVEKASTLTHAHRRSQIACGVYSILLNKFIEARDRESYRDALEIAERRYSSEAEWRYFAPLADIAERTRADIRSSGYVIDTIEAALWCVVTTDSYRDCVLKAVNLGKDTDTVAAVAGGLAGAIYGLDAIPADWLDTLIRREYIERLCRTAAERWGKIQ